jgi:hypothetical protein
MRVCVNGQLGAGDTTVTPGSLLDEYGTAAVKEMCQNKTDQINRSDGDWVELPASFTAMLGLQGPAVYIVWACGDRESPSVSSYIWGTYVAVLK